MFGPMAKYPTNDIRKLFTEIGCIMEDTSLLALIWAADDENDVAARFRQISDAHNKVGQLLAQIDSKF